MTQLPLGAKPPPQPLSWVRGHLRSLLLRVLHLLPQLWTGAGGSGHRGDLARAEPGQSGCCGVKRVIATTPEAPDGNARARFQPSSSPGSEQAGPVPVGSSPGAGLSPQGLAENASGTGRSLATPTHGHSECTRVSPVAFVASASRWAAWEVTAP